MRWWNSRIAIVLAAWRKPWRAFGEFLDVHSMSLSSGDCLFPPLRRRQEHGFAQHVGRRRLTLKGDARMRIEYLYRYPVKGLTAEALEQAEVETGGCIPWDRAFALAQGDSGFDPASPVWLPKENFMCQMKHAKCGAAVSVFDPGRDADDPGAGWQRRFANALDARGRARIARVPDRFPGRGGAGGQPAFHHVPGHVFGDQRKGGQPEQPGQFAGL